MLDCGISYLTKSQLNLSDKVRVSHGKALDSHFVRTSLAAAAGQRFWFDHCEVHMNCKGFAVFQLLSQIFPAQA